MKRVIDCLRLSVTDRCNLRCSYCMPGSGILYKGHGEILTFEEIIKLVNIFASLGIRKIRVTGGEPLVRRGLLYLLGSLVKIGGIEETAITTNGILLPFYAEGLRQSGVKRVNISLDTLDRLTYKSITGSDSIDKVFEGIRASQNAGLKPIKINTVIMKGINDSEIADFVEFAVTNDVTLRFIEFMKVTPLWRKEYYMSAEEIKDACRKRFKLKEIGNIGHSPAEYYEIENGRLLGFIKTNENNCRSCNRLRLASTGELRICLYEDSGTSLKELLQSGATEEKIKDAVIVKMGLKRHVDYRRYETSGQYMCSIGG